METRRITHLIGIDPDSDKSGVCFYDRLSKEFDLHNLRFFDLLDFLIAEKSKGVSFEVVIEAGWQNRSNWHVKANDSPQKAAKIGGNTERSHETGRKIVEMCEYLNLPYRLVRPQRSKYDAMAFKQTTGFKKRTNPEQRDACMLVYGY